MGDVCGPARPFSGDVSAENTVLPFRLANDLTLVAYEKKPQAVCHFVRFLAVSKGLGEVQLEDHQLTQRFKDSDPSCHYLCALLI